MVLSSAEESLISVVRSLPPDEADKVLIWARQLAELAGGHEAQWSDSWSEEDMRDVTSAALSHFEASERDGH